MMRFINSAMHVAVFAGFFSAAGVQAAAITAHSPDTPAPPISTAAEVDLGGYLQGDYILAEVFSGTYLRADFLTAAETRAAQAESKTVAETRVAQAGSKTVAETRVAQAGREQTAALPVGTIRLRVIPQIGGATVDEAIKWRVTTFGRDSSGTRPTIAEITGSTPELVLPAGWYVVHARMADSTIKHPVEVTAGRTFKYTLVKN